jgi:hypothetical protein
MKRKHWALFQGSQVAMVRRWGDFVEVTGEPCKYGYVPCRGSGLLLWIHSTRLDGIGTTAKALLRGGGR